MDATELRVMAAQALAEVGGGEGRVWRAAKLLRDRTLAGLPEIVAAINASLVGAPNAADLPGGSVVADDNRAWIKNYPSSRSQWRCTNERHYDDTAVDEALKAGATVLRVVDQPEVHVGQIWESCDKRDHGRKVRVVEIVYRHLAGPRPLDPRGTLHAVVELASERGRPWSGLKPGEPARAQPGRRTTIRLDRFRPNASGYRLVQDVED